MLKQSYIVSFLKGYPGPLSILFVHTYALNYLEEAMPMLGFVTSISDLNDTNHEPSVFNGLAGYLHTLLYVAHNTRRDYVNIQLIDEVCRTILSRINLKNIGSKELTINTANELTGILSCLLDVF
ncbi:hypothetical protein HZS_606 [Henneguya salminicola]|nr:hypothetical protein HZS_606 [Henneguya salminicola]